MSKAIIGAAELAGAAALFAADVFATGGIGLFATPWLASLFANLAIGGISMEAGAIADALTQNRGMGITTRQPAAFRQIIYGEQRVPGVIVYESTTGSKKDQYNLVIVIATHPCDAIVNLYLDGRQVYWTGSGPGNVTRNGVNFGGNADSATHIGPDGQHYNFGGLVYCSPYFGDQTAAQGPDGGLYANDPNWTTTAAGTPYLGGCTWVYLKLEYDPAMFPQFPEIRFTVRGKNNIYDPRLAAPPSITVLQRPTTTLNGWAANAHVGAYEEGVNQGYNWGLNSSATLAYTNPGNACDTDLTTYASSIYQHTHQYAGCVWSFAALSPSPSGLTATPSTTGGTLAAGSYFYQVTAITSSGESMPCAQATATTTGTTGSVALSWSAVTGATSYNVYRGTTSGGENVHYSSSTNSYTDTGAAATSGVPPALYLNVNSSVPAITGAARSAGIWYSLDGGTNWTVIYNQPYRAQQWDSIPLSPQQDCSQVQVMAFLDSHDDMNQNVYDIQLATGPQSSTNQNGYTTNWALIVADVLTDTQWGLGDTGSVNQAQLIAAANVCDEQIPLAAGGSESQYCCHWHFDCGTSPGDVLQTMMPAAMGRLSRIGAEWFIWPAYWQGPSYTFSESDLTGKASWQPYRKIRDLFNRVNGTYTAPNYPYNVAGDLYDSNGWYNGTIQNNFPFAFQPTNYPQYACDSLHGYATDVFLEQDNNLFLPKELVQNCVLSVTQAQRCAKIALMRNRQQGSGTLPMHLWAFRAQPLDVVEMTFSPYGWSSKQLEIISTRFYVDRSDRDTPVLRFQIGVQETDPGVYAWSVTEELSVYDVPSSPTASPYTITPPTGLTLTSNSSTAVTNSDGSVTPRIYASWTAPLDVRVTQIQIQYQASGASSWIDDGLVAVSTTSVYISGLISGQSYNVQIRSVTATGAYSIWDQATGCTVSAPNSTINSYTNNPAIDLSQPTATSISMGAVAVTFNNATVNYAARTFTIPTPSAATWYYVTIADPTQQGESGSPTLTATCQTSNALVGVQGNTYIGAINALPGGSATQILAGGWPAPQTFQVS